jgi:hypothetical protein
MRRVTKTGLPDTRVGPGALEEVRQSAMIAPGTVPLAGGGIPLSLAPDRGHGPALARVSLLAQLPLRRPAQPRPATAGSRAGRTAPTQATLGGSVVDPS